MCPEHSQFKRYSNCHSHQILLGKTATKKLTGPWHEYVLWRVLHAKEGLYKTVENRKSQNLFFLVDCKVVLYSLSPHYRAFMRFSWTDKMIHLIDKTGWLAFAVSLPMGLCLFLFMDSSPWLHLPSSSLSQSILHTFNSAPSKLSEKSATFFPAPVYYSLFLFFSIQVCGGCAYICVFFSLLWMTRRNLRAAGEFSSYPSALKPQRV